MPPLWILTDKEEQWIKQNECMSLRGEMTFGSLVEHHTGFGKGMGKRKKTKLKPKRIFACVSTYSSSSWPWVCRQDPFSFVGAHCSPQNRLHVYYNLNIWSYISKLWKMKDKNFVPVDEFWEIDSSEKEFKSTISGISAWIWLQTWSSWSDGGLRFK